MVDKQEQLQWEKQAYGMTKDQLKEMIKECLQEGASAENFVTFTISGGYHDYKTKPKDSTVTVTVGTALDILDLLRNQNDSDIKQLSFELSNHLPENHI